MRTERPSRSRAGPLVPTAISRMDLERAIGRLPEGCRAAFLLHDVEGFDHREVARILGVSEGTSKSQVHKARMKLRAMLGSMNCHQYEARARASTWTAHCRRRTSLRTRRCSARWSAHLADCAACRAIVEDLHTMRGRRPHARAARAARARVDAHRARDGLGGAATAGGPSFPQPMRWQPVAAAIMLLLLVAGAGMAWRQLSPGLEPAATVAARCSRPRRPTRRWCRTWKLS